MVTGRVAYAGQRRRQCVRVVALIAKLQCLQISLVTRTQTRRATAPANKDATWDVFRVQTNFSSRCYSAHVPSSKLNLFRCPIIRSPPRKVSPGRQFTGKNPPHPDGRRAWRIFTGKLSAGRDFSGGGGFYNGDTFYGAGNILTRGRHIKSVADFS